MWWKFWGHRADQWDRRIAALETVVTAMANAPARQPNGAPQADLTAIMHDIILATLEREKAFLSARTTARAMGNRRPRDASTGRFAAGRAADPRMSCRLCAKPDDPYVSAKEILWHGNGHPPGGPQAISLPTYGTNGGVQGG